MIALPSEEKRVDKKRPVYLDLTKIRLPLTGMVSILHRASGFALFLVIPYLLCFWANSLSNPESYAYIQSVLHQGLTRIFFFVILLALVYHWVAGIRHLLMDLGVGEEKISGRRGALIVLGLVLILAILLGIVLW